MKRVTLQALGVLAGVFLLGAVAGGATTYAYALHEEAAFMGPGHHEGRLRGFERRLRLTASQKQAVDAIFTRHREKMDSLKSELMKGCGAPLRAELDVIDGEIRAVLTPEQQQEFEEMRAERDRRGPFGPPGPPPGHGGWGRGDPP